MKGVSPLIATILLIAFTIAVAGILSVWLTSFARTQSQAIGDRSSYELICSYGGVSLSGMSYSGGWLTGKIENTRTIPLGNLSIQIIYTNFTSQKVNIFADLSPREEYPFNISASSNYETIRVITNCSSVYDEVSAGDVSV
jgi:flagellin-like protein